MQVHFDMDGVLADLDGALALDTGATQSDIRAAPGIRRTLIEHRRNRLGAQHYTTLRPLRLSAFRELFAELHSNGIEVHILTAADVLTASDVVTVYEGKQAWARKHYGDLIDDGTIRSVHVVANGEQKATMFGGPHRILVDAECLNTIYWRGTGGDVIDYSDDNHAACIRALRSMVYV